MDQLIRQRYHRLTRGGDAQMYHQFHPGPAAAAGRTEENYDDAVVADDDDNESGVDNVLMGNPTKSNKNNLISSSSSSSSLFGQDDDSPIVAADGDSLELDSDNLINGVVENNNNNNLPNTADATAATTTVTTATTKVLATPSSVGVLLQATNNKRRSPMIGKLANDEDDTINTNSILTNRLTMLEDPDRIQQEYFKKNLQHRNSYNNENNNENNTLKTNINKSRETNLSPLNSVSQRSYLSQRQQQIDLTATTSGSQKDKSKVDIQWPTTNNNYRQFNDHNHQQLAPHTQQQQQQQQQDQHPIFLASLVSILFLLLALIIYNWIYRRRQTNNSSAGCPFIISDINSSSSKSRSILNIWRHLKFPSQFGKAKADFVVSMGDKAACGGPKRKQTRSGEEAEGEGEEEEDEEVCFNQEEELLSCARNEIPQINFGCASGSEGIQLVERKPITEAGCCNESNNRTLKKLAFNTEQNERENDDVDDDIIKIDSIDSKNKTKQNDASANAAASDDDDDDDDEQSSTMVILKRRFAKNSLVVAAKSTKPKVRLITARVKKFIDDEAEELEVKRTLNPQQPWTHLLLAYFLTAIHPPTRRQQQEMTTKNDTLSSRQQSRDHELDEIMPTTTTDDQKSQPPLPVSESPIRVEIHHHHTHLQHHHQLQISQNNLRSCDEQKSEKDDKMIEMTVIGGSIGDLSLQQQQQQPSSASDLAEPIVCSSANNSNNITLHAPSFALNIDNHHHQQQQQAQKLSPSPVVNDGCSSLSGYSIFTPSPIEPLIQNQTISPSCGCNLINGGCITTSTSTTNNNSNNNILLHQPPLAVADLSSLAYGGLHFNQNNRSKSQGRLAPSPPNACHLIGGGGGANYRPCCSSVSPSTLNHQVQANIPVNVEQAHYQCYPQQQLCNQRQQQLVASEHKQLQFTNGDANCDQQQQQHYTRGPTTYYAGGVSLDQQQQQIDHSLAANEKVCTNSNHIKRQYENYYDDERQEAYQRLTASIGMEFGLGFGDEHHHHPHFNHQAAVASAGYGARAADILQYSRWNYENNMCQTAAVAAAAATSNHATTAATYQQHLQAASSQQHPLMMLPQNGGDKMLFCKCCQKQTNSLITDGNQQYLAAAAGVANTGANNQVQSNLCSMFESVKTTGGGSAGELVSSASTSLGGSDSGFAIHAASQNNNICRSPLCGCRTIQQQLPVEVNDIMAAQQAAPNQPMSILVQQPSFATPPPLLRSSATPQQQQHATATSSPLEIVTTNNGAHSSSVSVGKQSTSGPSTSPDEAQVLHKELETSSSAVEQSSNLNLVEEDISPLASASGTPSLARAPKWKHRRVLSQKQQQQQQQHEMNDYHLMADRMPRRMSIAGDQQIAIHDSGVASAIQQSAHLMAAAQAQQQQQHLLLRHRASIASDGISWAQQADLAHPNPNPNLNPHHSNHPNHHQMHHQLSRFNFSQYDQQHSMMTSNRPSDASLYDTTPLHGYNCANGGAGLGSGANGGNCGLQGGGKLSNYSSSGGSSSGIGISRSNCTNTPTSVFQYGSFGTTKADILAATETAAAAAAAAADYNHNPYFPPTTLFDHYQAAYYLQNQCNYYMLQGGGHHHHHALHARDDAATNQDHLHQMQASYSNRKFSLPVQLESQPTTDRLSPGDATTTLTGGKSSKLLFERNQLQRVDSSSLAAATTCLRQNGQQPHHGCQQLDSSSQAQQQQVESRRSSQTITRQSSFWLEDNSIDSIYSLTTASGGGGSNGYALAGFRSEEGSQFEVNQLPHEDERNAASAVGDGTGGGSSNNQETTSQRFQFTGATSQRPSISSLIVSADSIESVKQKPLILSSQAARMAPEGVQTAAAAAAMTDGSTNNNNNSSIETKSSSDAQPSSHSAKGSSSSGSPSSSSNSNSSARDKQRSASNNFRTMAYMRNRLSSSSTSTSTTSSPSPDFSRSSERFLGLASKSSSHISKRHLFKKLRSRRYPRLGVQAATAAATTSCSVFSELQPTASTSSNTEATANFHQHSAPTESVGAGGDSCRGKRDESEDDAKSEGYNDHSANSATAAAAANDGAASSATSLPPGDKKANISGENESDLGVDNEFLSTPNERPVSDFNSASLERQCRDLWKLRATLHDEACVGDNWSNYHQRLNRRYDSGYKSIENQLSSSLEGNLLQAPLNAATQQQQQQQQQATIGCSQAPVTPARMTSSIIDPHLLVRPQSGCSGSITRPETKLSGDNEKPAKVSQEDEQMQTNVEDNNDEEEELIKVSATTIIAEDQDEQLSSSQLQGDSIDTIDGKLADLELDDGGLECLLGEPFERECLSRSSKSSQEEQQQ